MTIDSLLFLSSLISPPFKKERTFAQLLLTLFPPHFLNYFLTKGPLMEVLAPEGIVIERADNMAGHESAGKSGQIVHLLIYNNIFFFSLHLLLLSTTVQQL